MLGHFALAWVFVFGGMDAQMGNGMHWRIIAVIGIVAAVRMSVGEPSVKRAPFGPARLVLSPPLSLPVAAPSLERAVTKARGQIQCIGVERIDAQHYRLDFQIGAEWVAEVLFRPSEPLEMYFLAQHLQERIASRRTVSVYSVYEALPPFLRRQVERPVTPKEVLVRLRDFLGRASLEEWTRYGSRSGAFLLNAAL